MLYYSLLALFAPLFAPSCYRFTHPFTLKSMQQEKCSFPNCTVKDCVLNTRLSASEGILSIWIWKHEWSDIYMAHTDWQTNLYSRWTWTKLETDYLLNTISRPSLEFRRAIISGRVEFTTTKPYFIQLSMVNAKLNGTKRDSTICTFCAEGEGSI